MFKAFLLKLSIDIMENSVSKKTTLGSLIALVKIPAIIFVLFAKVLKYLLSIKNPSFS